MKTFIQNDLHGIVGHRTAGNAKDFKSPLVVVYFALDFVKDVKGILTHRKNNKKKPKKYFTILFLCHSGTNYVRNRVIKVAQKLKSEGIFQPKITFAISDLSEYANELTESYGMSVNPGSKYILGLGAKGEKYKFEGEYSVENLEKFARDLLDGKLEQFMKSEPVPDYASTQDKVKTVVARNFDEIVNDDTKDVLIEFYAPWW